MNQTHILKNHQQLGPFDDALILASLQNGSFDYSDLCWREGWEDWKPLDSLFPRPAPPAPSLRAEPKAIEEKSAWEGRPSLINYSLSIAVGAISLIAIGVVPFLPWAANPEIAKQANPIIQIILLCIAVFVLAKALCRYFAQKYKITTHRVIVESGLFIKNSKQLRIKDIRSLEVSKNAFEGFLLGMGSLELSTAATDDAEIIFAGIRDADKVRDLVSRLQSQAD